MHFIQSLVLLTPLRMFCAPGTTNSSLHSTDSSPLSARLVTPSFFRWPDFWDRDVVVPSLSGSSAFRGNWSWALMSPLVFPIVKWVEPLSTWSHLLCIVSWHGTLPTLACRLLCESHTFSGVLLPKGDDFHTALQSAAGQLTCCCWLLVCFRNSCHQP